MIGYLIGNYKITQKIGEGGMGDVFKGIDLMLEREVAIKMLRPELARQQTIVDRFRAEAITLAKLNHPNIATLYNFVRQANDYFMVMEFVKGNTFESIIKKSGAIPFERAVQLFAQALEGIAHAHRLGIIHRDLKPANVMLMDSGLIKVMDFGIARVLGASRLTRTGNVIGTMEYMSPEQIRGEETDVRSDIYSAGILLYEMLTGRVPFESNSEYELMRKQIEDAPLPPRVFSKEIPLPLEQAIMRALAKKPGARFQSADEFRAILLKSLAGATGGLANSAANRQQQSAHSASLRGEAEKASDSKRAAAKKMPDTLDFTSEPPPTVKESCLPDPSQAILKEIRLAADAQDDLQAQAILKETRLGNHPEMYGLSHNNQSAGLYQQAPQRSHESGLPRKPSAVTTMIEKLNWKHYAAAVLLALFSIPVAFLASSDMPIQPLADQSSAKKDTQNRPEPKNETTAQLPATSTGAAPEPARPAPAVEYPDLLTPDETTVKRRPSEPSRGDRKVRRVGSPQPAPAKEPVRPSEKSDDDRKDEKKDDKKKEKKGGLFDKVKGGIKKINPFKKD